jgi:hypothetical protein
MSRVLPSGWLLFGALVFAGNGPDPALGQEPADGGQPVVKPEPGRLEPGRLEPGAKVELDWGGKAVSGEVVEQVRPGWYKVKFGWKDRELSPTVPEANLRPAAPLAQKPQLARKWKDKSGQFEIEATYSGVIGDNLQLRRADGKVIQLALDKLSAEDQAYVKSLAPAAVNAEPVNPFEAAAVVVPAKRAAAAARVTEFDREADYDSMKELGAQWVPAKPFVPDPLVRHEPPAGGKAIVLAKEARAAERDDFFESPQGIYLSAGGGTAAVVFVNSPPGGERTVRIVRCDVPGGKFTGEIVQPQAGTPADLSPSGELLAFLPEKFVPQGEKPMIEIARLGEKGLATVRRWNMGEHADWARRFEKLWFIGEDKLFAASSWGGNIVLWDIDQAKALWQLKVAGHHLPVMSNSRKQFAAWLDGGIGVFDAATGETLARFDATGDHGSVLAFSPDGQKIASVAGRTARVWDIGKGELLHEVWFPKPMSARSLDWAGEYLLVDRSYLVDLGKRIVLWQYELPNVRHEAVATMAGGVFWVLGGGGNSPYQLAGLTLPDPDATRKSESLSADGVLAIKPGAEVQIKINVPGATPEEVQQVTKALIAETQASGLKLIADAPITIECSIVDAGKETVNYRRFGFGPIDPFGPRGPVGPFAPFGPIGRRGAAVGEEGDEATVNKKLSVLSIKENGQEIWVTSGHFGAPIHVTQKEGQTIQEAVDAQKGNPVKFFLSVKLPKFVARHEAGGTYGKSKLLP